MGATHANDLKKTYATIADGYEQTHQGDIDLSSLEMFASRMPKQAKILDLGAGNGRDSRWFTEHGFVVTMFDLSPEMLAIAKKKVPPAKAVLGDMTEMNFRHESLDGVWARASLLHLTKEEGKQVVKKVFEILKKGGTFCLRLKEGEGEKEVVEDKYGKAARRFFAFYSEDEAIELLSSAGFENIQSQSEISKSKIAWVQVWGVKN